MHCCREGLFFCASGRLRHSGFECDIFTLVLQTGILAVLALEGGEARVFFPPNNCTDCTSGINELSSGALCVQERRAAAGRRLAEI